MITDGFMYLAFLIFLSAVLLILPRFCQGTVAQKFFRFLPPVVLIYLILMLLCTLKVWDLQATADTYGAVKNPLLYAMIFLMLLRCDLRKIAKLGTRMIIGFLAASFSIGLGFVIAHALLSSVLGEDAWKSLSALCGSWMGGGGNMLAIQAALDVSESSMAYALVIDSVCASLYVMFLLWVIGFSDSFNRWTGADTGMIDAVGRTLEEETHVNQKPLIWTNLSFLLGLGLLISAICMKMGTWINGALPFLDKATWTVLIVTALGILFALSPVGKLRGTEELSNVLLYITIALIASRADLSSIGNAPMWLIAGFMILLIHILLMILFAKLLKLDIFTCAVASLANIGGTATAPVLAGAYSSALVPVGIIMALLGYIIGTGGGLFVAQLMQVFS